MIPEIDSIGAAIVKGVCNPEAKDLAVDLGEFELGALLDEGVLREIPVIKSVIACRKTWTAIQDQLFLRKVVGFLTACPRFTEAEKEAFIREHLDDAQKAKKLGDTIVLILDRFDDMEKPELLAKFFAVFVRGKIDLETFRRLATAIDIGFIEDLKNFVGHCSFTVNADLASNLVRTGLVFAKLTNHEVGIRGEDYHVVGEFTYEATDLGRTFSHCLLIK
jgi:hypothetical protein